MHVDTHAHTHAHTQTYQHAHPRTHGHAYTCERAHMCMHAHVYTRVHTWTHGHMHTHQCTRVDAHELTWTRACISVRGHMHTHIYTHAQFVSDRRSPCETAPNHQYLTKGLDVSMTPLALADLGPGPLFCRFPLDERGCRCKGTIYHVWQRRTAHSPADTVTHSAFPLARESSVIHNICFTH